MSLPAHLVFEQSFHVSRTYGVRVTAGEEKVNDSTERCDIISTSHEIHAHKNSYNDVTKQQKPPVVPAHLRISLMQL